MKVLSWNILANEYIKKQYYPQVKEELLIREERFKLISNKLKEINADIILLQEVMSAEYKNLKELLSHKYFISKLIPIQWKGYPEGESGNITMIKKSKFTSIKQKENYITCKHRQDKFYIVNIHLDDSSQNRRETQISDILSKVNDKERVIIGGDCNEEYKKSSGIYKLLEDNNFNISITDFTYFIEKQMKIDNIFFKGLELKDSLVNNICGHRTISNINCQLEKYGSDHFPVIIKLNHK